MQVKMTFRERKALKRMRSSQILYVDFFILGMHIINFSRTASGNSALFYRTTNIVLKKI